MSDNLFAVSTLCLVVCFFVGCQGKAALAELEEFRAQAEVEEQNKERVKGLVEEFNKGNVENWRELFAPEFGYYQPSRFSQELMKEIMEVSLQQAILSDSV